ncbi:MAG: hypothetical protein FJ244_02565 [Nitrospira sp.]|nr:hypothetical protein [Nitrospira sp.]
MLKITGQQRTGSDSFILILEGRFAGPWVKTLTAYRREMSENQQPCTMIDLTGVTFIDAEGKVLLAQLSQ